MASRHKKYNDTLDYINRKEKAGELFVIRPKGKLPLISFERRPKMLQKAYDIGRQTAEEELERVKRFLGIKEVS